MKELTVENMAKYYKKVEKELGGFGSIQMTKEQFKRFAILRAGRGSVCWNKIKQTLDK